MCPCRYTWYALGLGDCNLKGGIGKGFYFTVGIWCMHLKVRVRSGPMEIIFGCVINVDRKAVLWGWCICGSVVFYVINRRFKHEFTQQEH